MRLPRRRKPEVEETVAEAEETFAQVTESVAEVEETVEAIARRAENVAFANALMATEISERNARKDSQENTARGLIATSGVLLTLLVSLANDAGVFRSGTSMVAKAAYVATAILAVAAAGCSMYAIWPRKYDRLGKQALAKFNTANFLDQPPHEVAGSVIATRIGIANTMDTRHEEKGLWVRWSLKALAGALTALAVVAVVLVIDPPPPAAPTSTIRILQSNEVCGHHNTHRARRPAGGHLRSDGRGNCVSVVAG